MSTNLQKAEIVRIEKNDTSAQRVAYVTLLSLLVASVGFNGLSANLVAFDPIATAIGVLPPLVLFGLSMLLERMSNDKTSKWGLGISIVVSLMFSWVHIALVVLHFAHLTDSTPNYLRVLYTTIAWLFPLIIDVPMILAGRQIMTVRNRRNNPHLTMSQAKANVARMSKLSAQSSRSASSTSSTRSTSTASSTRSSHSTPTNTKATNRTSQSN